MIIPCDPLSDAAFQNLFGNPKNIDVSLDFLNAVFEALGDQPVSRIKIIKPLQWGKFSGEKSPPPEALYLDTEGRPIQLVMVRKSYPELVKGMLFNWSKLYSLYFPRNLPCPGDFPVFTIWLHRNAFPTAADWLHTMTMVSDEPSGPRLFFKDMHVVAVDVERWKNRTQLSTGDLDRRRRLDQWLSFLTLRKGDIFDPPLRTSDDSLFEKAVDALGR